MQNLPCWSLAYINLECWIGLVGVIVCIRVPPQLERTLRDTAADAVPAQLRRMGSFSKFNRSRDFKRAVRLRVVPRVKNQKVASRLYRALISHMRHHS